MPPAENLRRLPPHESLVRRLLSNIKCTAYPPLVNLEQARLVPRGAVVFEGDSGGMIYLTCPAQLARCGPDVLRRLLDEVDALVFAAPDVASVKYEALRPGDGVWGGSGGGLFTGDLWLHPHLDVFDIAMQVRDVLAGRRGRLAQSTETLLLRGRAAAPDRRGIIRRLADLYRSRAAAARGEVRLAMSAKALAEFEALLCDGGGDWQTRLTAAEVAFDAGAYSRAAAHADAVLRTCCRELARGSQRVRWWGESIHAAHVILGRIAFLAGDTAGATAHLIEAGRAPIEPGAQPGQPDTVLAGELLAAGAHVAVGRYTSLCEITHRTSLQRAEGVTRTS